MRPKPLGRVMQITHPVQSLYVNWPTGSLSTSLQTVSVFGGVDHPPYRAKEANGVKRNDPNVALDW